MERLNEYVKYVTRRVKLILEVVVTVVVMSLVGAIIVEVALRW